MKILFFILFIFFIQNTFCQDNEYKSILQQQLEYYNSLGISGDEYEQINKSKIVERNKNPETCIPNKIVFGWHPYWSNGKEANYDWNLLTDLSYFAYEVNASTGAATSTHSWASASVVSTALNNGVRVNLCATLFSNHATFFASSTSQQTLITNLISMIQSRGATGINIDFEGVPASQKTNFTNFLIDLSNQLHTAIPGSQLSMALYAVDWNSVFDFPALNNYIDYYAIMGYDYYYGGSTTAGPTDPLFHFGSTYNYTLSKSISSYLKAGAPASKLLLAVPYYGFEYTSASSTVGSAVLNPPNSAVRFYYDVAAGTGNYSAANNFFESGSYSNGWIFPSSGNYKHCYVNNKYTMEKRYDVVNRFGIAGIGIWALGYDDGYTNYWEAIQEKLTSCSITACTDTIFDMGGPNKDYYNNEDYTFTISPTGASGLSLTFTQFNLELNYDYLWIYDGVGTTNLIGQYTGTNSPGTITATGNALTLRFKSDGATVSSGYTAIWNCVIDNVSPTTQISANNWQTSDFNATFTDWDNLGINEKFYQVLDYNGTEWRANVNNGFFNDNFSTAIHSEWTQLSGTWSINSGHLNQTQQVNSNTNIYTSVNQDNTHSWLYHWQMKLDGTGTNRRAGLYIFSDNPTLTQRGNSYMIYYRADQNHVQLYTVKNDVIQIVTDDTCVVNPGVWYDYKVYYNPSTGELKTYQNNILTSSYTDPAPLASGTAISLRNGDCDVMYDDIKVYKSRTSSANITVGSGTSDVRYQNPNPATPSCRIKSIIIDDAENFSNLEGLDVNIDWTKPLNVIVKDGVSTDIDTIASTSTVSANWETAIDTNSNITEYFYSIGTTQGQTNVLNWTSNSTSISATINSLSLSYNTTYYFNVKSLNEAGLYSDISSSDGFIVANPVTASFSANSTSICNGDEIQFYNQSVSADSVNWYFTGGTPSASNVSNPVITYNSSGNYQVQLIAFNGFGSDTLISNNYVTVNNSPVADFITNKNSGQIPLTILFTNQSLYSTSYLWDFGNNSSSIDINPYTVYSDTGHFSISLISCNLNCPCDTFIYSNIYAFDTTVYISKHNTDKAISLIPNIFKDQTFIYIDNNNNISVKQINIYSTSSKLIDSKNYNSFAEKIEVNTSELEDGIYYFRILLSNNTSINIKGIKIK